MDIHVLETKIHQMVDDLQGLCSTVGLSNTANEEVVVTSVFLYKFLNDKFMYNLEQFANLSKKEQIDCFLKAKELVLGRFKKIEGEMFGLVVKDHGLCINCPSEPICSPTIRTICMIADDLIYDAFDLVSCCRVVQCSKLTMEEADQIEDRYQLSFCKK